MRIVIPARLLGSCSLWLTIGMALFSCGCGDDKPGSPHKAGSDSNDSQPSNPDGKPEVKRPKSVEITGATVEEIVRARDAHNGRVVLVYLWEGKSTSRAALAKLEGTSQKLAAKGLVCMTVALRTEKDKALGVLKKEKVFCENFFLSESLGKLQEAPGWSFAKLPIFLLFDREGKRVDLSAASEDWEQVAAAVQQELK